MTMGLYDQFWDVVLNHNQAATSKMVSFTTAAPSNATTSTINETVPNTSANTTSLNMLVCSEGFYFDENGTDVCRPRCGEFLHEPLAVIISEVTATCVGLISSVTLIVLALTLQRDTL